VMMRLISFLLDILSKLSLGYSSEKIMNHKLRKRKPEAGGGPEASPITQGETALHWSLSPQGRQVSCSVS